MFKSNENRFFRVSLAGLLILLFGFFSTCDSDAEDHLKTIIIDPGHGGHEYGLKGTENQTEKSFTLKLAKIMTGRFTAQHRVVLTRSEDYIMTSASRASEANHAGGNVFISLHLGKFSSPERGLKIFYYQDDQKQKYYHEDISEYPLDAPALWEQVQKKHLKSGLRLAEDLRAAFAETTFKDCKIIGAPLTVLQGVDMPAVLVEVNKTLVFGPKTEPDRILQRLRLSSNKVSIQWPQAHPAGLRKKLPFWPWSLPQPLFLIYLSL